MEGNSEIPVAPRSSSSANGKKLELKEKTAAVSPRKGNAVGLFFYAVLTVCLLSVVWNLIEGKANLWPVLIGLLFFEVVSRIISSLVAKPTFLPGLQPKDVNNFLNTAVSLLHSILVSIAVTVVLIRTVSRTNPSKMWTHAELTSEPWPGAFVVLGLSCGYSAYDQWDMIRRELYNPKFPDILIHHAVLLTCFIFALCKNSCVNYMILTLICEWHSIFLHLRKVNIYAGGSRKWDFYIRLEWILNWATFLTTRIGVHGLISLKLVIDWRKFGYGIELPLAVLGMIGLNLLNLFLGKSLYRAYLRESSGMASSRKAAG